MPGSPNKIKIELGKNSYDIVIGENLLPDISEYLLKILKPKSKVFIITDSNVIKHYGFVAENLSKEFNTHLITLPAGEETKRFKNLEHIIDEVLKHKPERKSCLLALGGGVIGDITGFAASIILRGLNFVQVPTTLLAAVDSSVGGKTAVNSKHGKNLVGTFYQPKLVLTDLSTFKTLPRRELLAGYAEIVKYGLIVDKDFYEYLEKQNDISDISYLVQKSCETKADIVSRDEKEEQDLRALLNLGHTFGHALEAVCNYDGTLLHGEAVAVGMVLAFKFSEKLGICKKGNAERVEKLLVKHGLRTQISQVVKNVSAERLIELMYGDKKVSGGNLVFVLVKDIGEAFVKKDVDEKLLKEFLQNEITI